MMKWTVVGCGAAKNELIFVHPSPLQYVSSGQRMEEPGVQNRHSLEFGIPRIRSRSARRSWVAASHLVKSHSLAFVMVNLRSGIQTEGRFSSSISGQRERERKTCRKQAD